MPRLLWLSAAAAAAAATSSVEVSSSDGLTIVTINATSGDLLFIASPGHVPLEFGAGSGSFIGWNNGATVHEAVYPNVVIAPCNASSPLQQFTLDAGGRITAADGAHCLDVWNCGTANGTVVDLYPCTFSATCGDAARTINELFTFDVATGELSSQLGPAGALCVEVSDGGAGPAVDLWRCDGGANQRWAHDASSRQFSSAGSAGMCLSAPPPPLPPPPPPPPCAWLGGAAVAGGGGAAVTVARNASCLGGAATVLVTDTFAAAPSSVQWSTAYAVVAASGAALPAFSLPLGASLRPPAGGAPAPLALWAPWTRGCVANGPGMCFGAGAWAEPFSPAPLQRGAPAALYRLGNRDFGPALAQLGSGVSDSLTVPLATLLRAGDDFGATLLLSPADALLELLLRVDGERLDFARMLRRLSAAAPPVAYTAHLRAHASDWRPALQLLLDAFPDFVLPHAANASEFDGLGGYSWQAPLNSSYAAAVGFRTNWELSGTFMPYDGLFAPYQDEWLNLGPINAGLPSYNVSYERIADFDAQVLAAGLKSLSYFDVGNWGVSIDTARAWPNLTCGLRPSGAPAPCPTPEGSNAFLQHYLGAALLDDGWSVAGGAFRGAKSDWVGTTDMDPSEPFFEELLVEQLQRRMSAALVPSAQGIAIDRFDYSAYYSYKRDDGLSWIPQAGGGAWGPAQSLLSSHIHTYARLAGVLRAAAPDKVMLGNCNTLCRIDLAGAFDGGFSEGAALNAVAWLGLRRPAILWTYSLDGQGAAALDAFFQQHLLMRVFPMAPMPGNDHSILPGSALVQGAYQDYAPLFLALRGCEWVLDAVRPVSAAVAGGGAAPQTNIFRARGTSAEAAAPGQLLVVVVLGDAGAAAARVEVAGAALLGGAATVRAFGLVPGARQGWQPLGTLSVVAGAVVAPAVPMLRGCAFLRLVPDAPAAAAAPAYFKKRCTGGSAGYYRGGGYYRSGQITGIHHSGWHWHCQRQPQAG